jgi:broad specificity phosphatase PhoE
LAATLILVRHAAHGHLDRILSGRTPGVPLTQAGRAQAARLAARLAARRPAVVHASPIERAVETATVIADAAGVELKHVEALNEIDFGEWTARAFDDLAGDPDWDRWNAERATARPPGGESMGQVQARVVAHLDAVAREHADETVVLVSHADTIRAAVLHGLRMSLNDYWRLEIDPASATTITWGDGWAKLTTLNERED